jgi:hypothetical protein
LIRSCGWPGTVPASQRSPSFKSSFNHAAGLPGGLIGWALAGRFDQPTCDRQQVRFQEIGSF